MEQKKSILIIDDESQIRKILKITLEAIGYKIIEASTGEEGILLAANHRPSLIILDLGLPDKDGLDVLKELRSFTKTSVIILSVRNSDEDIVAALDFGADDYLTKPFSVPELSARIRVALRHSEVGAEDFIIENGAIRLNITSHIIEKDGIELKLTGTEYNLILLFLKNTGRVLTHSYIVKEIWGNRYANESRSLRVFIAQIRKKIETDPANPEYILTESGIGYRMADKRQ